MLKVLMNMVVLVLQNIAFPLDPMAQVYRAAAVTSIVESTPVGLLQEGIYCVVI